MMFADYLWASTITLLLQRKYKTQGDNQDDSPEPSGITSPCRWEIKPYSVTTLSKVAVSN